MRVHLESLRPALTRTGTTLIAVIATGCVTVRPDYHAPETVVPDRWEQAVSEEMSSEEPELESLPKCTAGILVVAQRFRCRFRLPVELSFLIQQHAVAVLRIHAIVHEVDRLGRQLRTFYIDPCLGIDVSGSISTVSISATGTRPQTGCAYRQHRRLF